MAIGAKTLNVLLYIVDQQLFLGSEAASVEQRSVGATLAELDRLCLFGFAWAMASILHTMTFGDRLNAQHPFCLALVVAAAAVILFPRSIAAFLVMLVCSMGNTLDWMPFEPNHILFEFIINLGIASALLRALARHWRLKGTLLITPADRAALFDAFAPFVRISLVLLYFYAVLHKLNSDYFSVDISCSTFLWKGYSQRIDGLPDNNFLRWGAVWGTLLVEAAIPLLLYVRKTRWAGILLGCGFHYFLSVHPHPGLYSFSALLFALFVLFMPVELPGRIQQKAVGLLGSKWLRWLPAVRGVFATGMVGLVALGLSGHTYFQIGLSLWLGWGLLYMAAYVLASRRAERTPDSYRAMFKVRPVAFWLVPLLVFCNGLCPYVGLKTEKSFAMFSNLRTEGGISNHLLIRKPLYLTNWQLDLVDIKATDLKALQVFVDNRQLITYFELRRIASEARTNFFVQFVRNSQLQTARVANGQSNLPGLTTPYPWLEAKFVYFRPIDKGSCLCKH